MLSGGSRGGHPRVWPLWHACGDPKSTHKAAFVELPSNEVCIRQLIVAKGKGSHDISSNTFCISFVRLWGQYVALTVKEDNRNGSRVGCTYVN